MKKQSLFLFIAAALFATSSFAQENVFSIDKTDLGDKIAKSFHLANISKLSLSYDVKNYKVSSIIDEDCFDDMTKTETHNSLSPYYPYYYSYSTTYNKIVLSESPKDRVVYDKAYRENDDAPRIEREFDGQDLNLKTSWQAQYIASTITSNEVTIPVQITFTNAQNTYSCYATQHILKNQSNMTIHKCNGKDLKLVLPYKKMQFSAVDVSFGTDQAYVMGVGYNDLFFYSTSPQYSPWVFTDRKKGNHDEGIYIPEDPWSHTSHGLGHSHN